MQVKFYLHFLLVFAHTTHTNRCCSKMQVWLSCVRSFELLYDSTKCMREIFHGGLIYLSPLHNLLCVLLVPQLLLMQAHATARFFRVERNFVTLVESYFYHISFLLSVL